MASFSIYQMHHTLLLRYIGSSREDLQEGRKKRAKSEDRLLVEAKGDGSTGLLSNSALNERYFDERNGTKSKSLDNLLTSDVSLTM